MIKCVAGSVTLSNRIGAVCSDGSLGRSGKQVCCAVTLCVPLSVCRVTAILLSWVLPFTLRDSFFGLVIEEANGVLAMVGARGGESER